MKRGLFDVSLAWVLRLAAVVARVELVVAVLLVVADDFFVEAALADLAAVFSFLESFSFSWSFLFLVLEVTLSRRTLSAAPLFLSREGVCASEGSIMQSPSMRNIMRFILFEAYIGFRLRI